jgi:hypothetical protein
MAHALRHLICWLLLATLGAAAEPPPASRLLRFTVFSAAPIEDVAFVPRPEAVPQKIVFYPTARSPGYEVRGMMPLKFFDSNSGAVVAEAVVPPEIHEALLLFATTSGGSATGRRFRVFVLDDGIARHGPRGLAIVNLSGLELTGTAGRQNVGVAAGLNPTLAIGRSTAVTLRTLFRDRSYQSFGATIELQPGERALLILFPPFYPGSLEVQSRLLIDMPSMPTSR